MASVMSFQPLGAAGDTSKETTQYTVFAPQEVYTQPMQPANTMEGLMDMNMNAFMMNQEVSMQPEMPMSAIEPNPCGTMAVGLCDNTSPIIFTAVPPFAEGEEPADMPVYHPLSEYQPPLRVPASQGSRTSSYSSFLMELYTPPTPGQNYFVARTPAPSVSSEDADGRVIRSQRMTIDNLTAELECKNNEIENHEVIQENLEETLNLANLKISNRDDDLARSTQRILAMKQKIARLEEVLSNERTKRTVLEQEVGLLKTVSKPQQVCLVNRLESTALAEVAAAKRKLRKAQRAQAARKSQDLRRESEQMELRETLASFQFRKERYEREVKNLKRRVSFYERRLSAVTQAYDDKCNELYAVSGRLQVCEGTNELLRRHMNNLQERHAALWKYLAQWEDEIAHLKSLSARDLPVDALPDWQQEQRIEELRHEVQNLKAQVEAGHREGSTSLRKRKSVSYEE
ncbi:uncharacterized protein BDV14DRAFT_202266 [Aspergillus stella-maris]|uniref:uncharacterized protein n=1 Tax=Aspergillus stella-maris TaxID=1810926 RepID=UPI003CCDB485